MRRRDGPVESVGEHRNGSHGDFTLDDPAGPQPLGDAYAAGTQPAHGHRRRRRRERAGQRLGQIGGQVGRETRVDRGVEFAVNSVRASQSGVPPRRRPARRRQAVPGYWPAARAATSPACPRVTRPRTASAKSSTHSSEFQAGWNPHSSRNREVSISGCALHQFQFGERRAAHAATAGAARSGAERGSDLTEGRHARGGEIDRAAVDFGVQDRAR